MARAPFDGAIAERARETLDGHGSHATRPTSAGAERAARLGLEKWEIVNLTYEDVVERPYYVVSIIRPYLEVRRPQGRQEPA
jgi:hypothetical protein